jgi:hypothetical protein
MRENFDATPLATESLATGFVTNTVTIWKLGRTVCVYSMVQRREKEKDSRYIQEASAPVTANCIRPLYIIHISIWNVSFSILIGQNSVAEWLSG